jgi:hypothetical protein
MCVNMKFSSTRSTSESGCKFYFLNTYLATAFATRTLIHLFLGIGRFHQIEVVKIGFRSSA